MPEPARDDDIAAHIAAIAASTHEDRSRLAESLGAGSAAERTEPAARAWVSRWRPRGPAPAVRLCGCSNGRCLVCN